MAQREPPKPFPIFKSDAEAERFVAEADLSEYDFSEFKPAHFEFAKKTERVNMRLPEGLLRAVKACAAPKGMPYQRIIRQTRERAVAERKSAAFPLETRRLP
jgi:predicted DNA binding CopG/RHH family protein